MGRRQQGWWRERHQGSWASLVLCVSCPFQISSVWAHGIVVAVNNNNDNSNYKTRHTFRQEHLIAGVRVGKAFELMETLSTRVPGHLQGTDCPLPRALYTRTAVTNSNSRPEAPRERHFLHNMKNPSKKRFWLLLIFFFFLFLAHVLSAQIRSSLFYSSLLLTQAHIAGVNFKPQESF